MQFGQQDIDFPKPYQWISPDDGEVKRPIPSRQSEHAFDKRVSFEIRELAQV
jgi:hypothetical protein